MSSRSGKKEFVLSFLISLAPLFSATPSPVIAEHGMVVSASELASQVGIEIMQNGGNAIDAAVATGFALAVTYPQAGNIGGGGFMVAQMADGEQFSIDFREMAPETAHRNMYLDDSSQVIEGKSLYTHQAAGVPGTVDGLLRAWRDYGSGNISRRELLTPAIRLAKKGFTLTYYAARYLNYFTEYFQRNDGAAAIFIKPDGQPWQAGDRLVQKDLAQTLKRIARQGQDGFYNGKTADLIVQEMEDGDGLISKSDLTKYQSQYRPPVTGIFRDSLEIVSMGPPSSGGALLVQMLNMLEAIPGRDNPVDSLEWSSADYTHLLTEIERRAFADRAEHMGDPDYWDVPLAMLMSKEYAQERISDMKWERKTPSDSVFAGNPSPWEHRETTHYSVVDRWGNAVSVTTTLNTGFGCGIVVEGAGFFLNNEMDDFSAKPGVPNVYGLVGKEANAIQPGKRPLSSMTPAIVNKNGEPYIIIGTPGGSTIITTVLQVILNVTVYEMDIQQAVSMPRVHHQWLPDVIMVEPFGIAAETRTALEARGHEIVLYRWGYIGQANGIVITQSGLITGGADVRGENAAAGY